MKQISTILVFVLPFCWSLTLNSNGFQPFVPSSSYKPSTQRYSASTNSDIRHLLLSGIKGGSHPTIVAIPLYIRNNLSKLQSLFDLLSTTSLQNESSKTREISTNPTKVYEIANPVKTESQIQNSSLHINKFATQPPKLTKSEPKTEPQIIHRHHIKKEQIYDNDNNKPFENMSPLQWSSVVGVQNRYTEPNDKITLLRRPYQPRQSSGDDRKQTQVEYDSVGHQNYNKLSGMRNNEQHFNDNSDFESNTRKNKNNYDSYERNYPRYSAQSISDQNSYKVDTKSTPVIGSQINSYDVDNSAEAIDQKYISIQKDNEKSYQYDETPKKVFNDYQSHSKSVNVDKSRYPSSYSTTYDTDQYTIQSLPKTYSSKTYSRENYDNSYYTNQYTSSSPNQVFVADDTSPAYSPHPGSNNLKPISTSNHNLHSTTSANSGSSYPKNSYAIDSPTDYLPNNYNSNPYSISSENLYQSSDQKQSPVSHQSNDYSISEDIECNDESGSDYISPHSSPTYRPQTTKQEIDTKINERDNYDTEDLDPTKLDLKIVHLPVSLLRRLIGSGDIGLPSFQ